MEDAGDQLHGAVVVEDIAHGIVNAALGFESHLALEDEGAVQAAGAAAVESAVGEGEGVPIGGAARRDVIADGESGEGAELFSDFAAALGGLRRLRDVGGRRSGAGGNAGEMLLGEGEAGGGMELRGV